MVARAEIEQASAVDRFFDCFAQRADHVCEAGVGAVELGLRELEDAHVFAPGDPRMGRRRHDHGITSGRVASTQGDPSIKGSALRARGSHVAASDLSENEKAAVTAA